MIAHLTGQLLHKTPAHVIIDVGGVGYEVRISLHTFSTIKALDHCQLFIYQYVKGDIQALYGFASLEEKHWFLHLINVNSIGPRTALTILSSLSPTELAQAIVNNQVGTLKSIKGIGDKAAQRIVLELQSKLGQITASGTSAVLGPDSVGQEALAALMKLGIAQPAAEKALAKARKGHPGEVSVETLIKEALQGA